MNSYSISAPQNEGVYVDLASYQSDKPNINWFYVFGVVCLGLALMLILKKE